MTIDELREEYDRACTALDRAIDHYGNLPANTAAADVKIARQEVKDAEAAANLAKSKYEDAKAGKLQISVSEPDLYAAKGRSFFRDLFAAQVKGDPLAADRIKNHQQYEVNRYAGKLGVDVEQFAVSTSTLGGIIPPQYLVNLYAKASRNGRVFADQVNRDEPLPAEGMSLIVPRLTQGTAADVQAAEGDTAATQDPTESDLTIPVRTIAGYIPVSRQTLDRGAYSEAILFEDLIARYWSKLDLQCLDGSGSSGQIAGLLGVSGVSASTASTATVAGVWPKIADVIQQINTAMGGLGYVADAIFMHPRRWGFFEAALDSSDRPVFGIQGAGPYFNVEAEGKAAGYGLVGRMHGLPVYTDANIPTNLGSGTNEDRIIVTASRVVHLWESEGDGRPITVAFEQQAGTSLQVQLVAYGYAAFTADRYAAASGVVSGAGLATPTF